MTRAGERFEVRYWGVRGSIPTPGPETVRYGGNTTCLEVRCDDEIILIDTGTGARALGKALVAEAGDAGVRVSVIFSHLHFDHVQGLPFFDPLYLASSDLAFYTPQFDPGPASRVLDFMLTHPWFPVDASRVPATVTFHAVEPGATFHVGPVRVRTCQLNHPGGAIAYRFEHAGGAFVHASDIEHAGTEPDPRLVALATGADFLSYDSMYVEGPEYERHRGYGHSTWQAGVRLAAAAEVGTFVAFHHDPAHDDAFMDELGRALALARPGSLVAQEGMTLDVLAAARRRLGEAGSVPREAAQ